MVGDAESMEIIVNLGPLRSGRPLSVQQRAPTPDSRAWWDRDQDPGRPSGLDPDSKHAAYHAGKFAAGRLGSQARACFLT